MGYIFRRPSILFFLKKALYLILICAFCVPLVACGRSNKRAPIIYGWHKGPSVNKPPQNSYIVQKGDTLYSVAWAFDMDFRKLAKINHLNPPYSLKHGQRLLMTATYGGNKAAVVRKKTTWKKKSSSKVQVITGLGKKPKVSYAKKAKTKNVASKKTVKRVKYAAAKMNRKWVWPARGKVVSAFSQNQKKRNKGIDIAGKFGSKIVASNNGRVVYCGSGIPSYGNLIIIKNSNAFLSAYAHNKTMLVKEGDVVRAGQKIALMGKNNAGKSMVHFEIRYKGKPVNPRKYL